jgi:hypothetical protein
LRNKNANNVSWPVAFKCVDNAAQAPDRACKRCLTSFVGCTGSGDRDASLEEEPVASLLLMKTLAAGRGGFVYAAASAVLRVSALREKTNADKSLRYVNSL